MDPGDTVAEGGLFRVHFQHIDLGPQRLLNPSGGRIDPYIECIERLGLKGAEVNGNAY